MKIRSVQNTGRSPRRWRWSRLEDEEGAGAHAHSAPTVRRSATSPPASATRPIRVPAPVPRRADTVKGVGSGSSSPRQGLVRRAHTETCCAWRSEIQGVGSAGRENGGLRDRRQGLRLHAASWGPRRVARRSARRPAADGQAHRAVKVMLDGYTQDRFRPPPAFLHALHHTMKQEPVMEQLLPLSGERLGSPRAIGTTSTSPRRRSLLEQVSLALTSRRYLPQGGRRRTCPPEQERAHGR